MNEGAGFALFLYLQKFFKRKDILPFSERVIDRKKVCKYVLKQRKNISQILCEQNAGR